MYIKILVALLVFASVCSAQETEETCTLSSVASAIKTLSRNVLDLDSFQRTKLALMNIIRQQFPRSGLDIVTVRYLFGELATAFNTDTHRAGFSISKAGCTDQQMIQLFNMNKREVAKIVLDLMDNIEKRISIELGVPVKLNFTHLLSSLKEGSFKIEFLDAAQEFKDYMWTRVELMDSDWKNLQEYLDEIESIPECGKEDTRICYPVYFTEDGLGGQPPVVLDWTKEDGTTQKAHYFGAKPPVEGDCPAWEVKYADACYPKCPSPLKRTASATCEGYVAEKYSKDLHRIMEKTLFSLESGLLSKLSRRHAKYGF